MTINAEMEELRAEGFWTLYLSVILIVIVITVAALLKPPAPTIAPPENSVKAAINPLLVPLPLGPLDQISEEALKAVVTMVDQHNIHAEVLIGGNPSSTKELLATQKWKELFTILGGSNEGIEVLVSNRFSPGEVVVEFLKEEPQ